jgi:hypothetical protein
MIQRAKPFSPGYHLEMKTVTRAAAGLLVLGSLTIYPQNQRRIFSKIFTGEPYAIECYLPQITNAPPTFQPGRRPRPNSPSP